MNNAALAGIIVGTVVLAAAGSIAASSGFNPFNEYATVVSVEPAFHTTRTPRQVCGDAMTAAMSAADVTPEAATPPAPPVPPAPEAAPAEGETGEATEAGPCVVVYDTSSIQSGYDVTYELDGARETVRMDHVPGERIPVEHGEIVLTLR